MSHWIVVAARGRPHRRQRKAAFVVGVDQFFLDRRDFGQNAKPANGINALKFAVHSCGNGLATDTVLTVATDVEIAFGLAPVASSMTTASASQTIFTPRSSASENRSLDYDGIDALPCPAGGQV